MHWVRKMIDIFDDLDEFYRQAKVGEDPTTHTGCRFENMVFVFCYRQDAERRQTAGVKFTHGPKISIFARQWRLVFSDTFLMFSTCSITMQSFGEILLNQSINHFISGKNP